MAGEVAKGPLVGPPESADRAKFVDDHRHSIFRVTCPAIAERNRHFGEGGAGAMEVPEDFFEIGVAAGLNRVQVDLAQLADLVDAIRSAGIANWEMQADARANSLSSRLSKAAMERPAVDRAAGTITRADGDVGAGLPRAATAGGPGRDSSRSPSSPVFRSRGRWQIASLRSSQSRGQALTLDVDNADAARSLARSSHQRPVPSGELSSTTRMSAFGRTSEDFVDQARQILDLVVRGQRNERGGLGHFFAANWR